jgi:arylsulfatase A-like enzyme
MLNEPYKMTKKPNIVFFFTDDQRFDTIGALNNKDIITPNMDRLVSMGTSFTQAHIPCGTVGAVCMPSRAMLFTGRTLFHLEQNGESIPEDHITLGEALRSSGYRTFGTGKWHNGTEAYARSFSDGAEIMFGGMGDHWNVQACDFDQSGQYPKVIPQVLFPFQNNRVDMKPRYHVTPGKHSTELFAEKTIDFLESYKAKDPYFIYLSFMAPHDPRTMPERFKTMYNPDDLNLPPNLYDEHPVYDRVKSIRDEVLAPYPRTKSIVREHLAEYYAMITHLDDEIGKVMAAVEAREEMDNTIFVFAGDNGLALGQHGLFGKQNHYEHSIRVPLIFAGPGIPKGQSVDSYAYLLDIFPTLCDILDIKTPTSVEGRSLKDAMNDPDISTRDTLYFAYSDMMRSVKNHSHKLIEYLDHGKLHTELYDLKNDPWEVNNLSQSELATVETLRARLKEYSEEWDDRSHPMGASFWQEYQKHL